MPSSRRERGIVVVSDIADVAAGGEYLPSLQAGALQKAAVIGELKMQVAGILYLHIIIRILLSLLQ